ncbi:hypothetical protein COLO4_20235 [Corchorus olitorius]|uniref:Uncharacterized protein n=1 Tax=Corchorus olitorius TaxID=93759 RepID=A0A1R3J113_9ROSI|nr:hypothetical protein COLO4_20235 [Corchorus olitorius]
MAHQPQKAKGVLIRHCWVMKWRKGKEKKRVDYFRAEEVWGLVVSK